MGFQLTIVMLQNLISVKKAELALGIGPFVVKLAVERKIGNSAFSAMTINAYKMVRRLIEIDKKDYILKYLILLMKWIKKLINLKKFYQNRVPNQ